MSALPQPSDTAQLHINRRVFHPEYGSGLLKAMLRTGACAVVWDDGVSRMSPPVDELTPIEVDPPLATAESGRHLVLTPASEIKPRRTTWLWQDRLALGTLSLLAGREGLGKSTMAYWLAARITKGELPGEDLGRPRSVLVCAAEDSWEHTIVPRLIAAEADLTKVYRIEVRTADEITTGLTLPRDLHQLETAIADVDGSLILLDPLMSRISEGLDTHKDGDVRRALEPLAAIADRAQCALLGLIHHNKSASSDPLQLVMGSKAFTAVARSVHSVVPDPDDEEERRRLFGTPKNNLGRTDLVTLAFIIEGHQVETDEGLTTTGRLTWVGEVDGSIAEAMRRSATDPDERSAVAEAGDWLTDYLTTQGGTAPSAEIKSRGRAAGHSQDALKRARARLKLPTDSSGFPRVTFWSLPGTQLEQPDGATPRGDQPTAPTALTEQSEQPDADPVRDAPTGHALPGLDPSEGRAG